MNKPGYTTTELYTVLIGLVLSVLVMNGTLTDEESQTWRELLIQLGAIVIPVATYVWSRTRLKQASG